MKGSDRSCGLKSCLWLKVSGGTNAASMVVEERTIPGFSLTKRMSDTRYVPISTREDRRSESPRNEMTFVVGLTVPLQAGWQLRLVSPKGFNLNRDGAGGCEIMNAEYLGASFSVFPDAEKLACHCPELDTEAFITVDEAAPIGNYGMTVIASNPASTPMHNYWRITIYDSTSANKLALMSESWIQGFNIQEILHPVLFPYNPANAIPGNRWRWRREASTAVVLEREGNSRHWRWRREASTAVVLEREGNSRHWRWMKEASTAVVLEREGNSRHWRWRREASTAVVLEREGNSRHWRWRREASTAVVLEREGNSRHWRWRREASTAVVLEREGNSRHWRWRREASTAVVLEREGNSRHWRWMKEASTAVVLEREGNSRHWRWRREASTAVVLEREGNSRHWRWRREASTAVVLEREGNSRHWRWRREASTAVVLEREGNSRHWRWRREASTAVVLEREGNSRHSCKSDQGKQPRTQLT